MSNVSGLRPVAAFLPWTDRQGRLSGLKLAVFLIALAPALWYLTRAAMGLVQPEPARQLVFVSGDWAIRFLVATLAVSPLRRITGWGKLAGIRRMLGLTALAYGLAHLMLYVIRENLDLWRVTSEIVLRFYLTIGFAALVALVALGVTSTDSAIRRMGPRWHRLHELVYPATALAAFHYFLQSKSDVSQATLLAGLFLLVMIYRGAARLKLPLSSPLVLAGLGLLAGLGTAGIEYLWYHLATGVPAERVFLANFNWQLFTMPAQIRPSWWVALAGLITALLPMISARLLPQPVRRQR
ncbi:Flavocytochrome yedZ [Pannonibacter phragmitetus]|uniref:Protein-methionine-sulfoxide reductase heme-binding subunit MsrQ n=1 Tax=Pannonibacter phragmitetus TaxID=121719 RepID=A0A379A0K1_9HYPH|nr:protein-methionine-sulfoxide reductase heme-binding subunit MsrQ [Pannonibacter phragmitetus]SUB03015.1 Flavocytochrome yedZ [Pannonibacter phragmitetus]